MTPETKWTPTPEPPELPECPEFLSAVESIYMKQDDALTSRFGLFTFMGMCYAVKSEGKELLFPQITVELDALNKWVDECDRLGCTAESVARKIREAVVK